MAKKIESEPRFLNRNRRPSGRHDYFGVTRSASTLYEMNRRDKLCKRWGLSAGPSETTRAKAQ